MNRQNRFLLVPSPKPQAPITIFTSTLPKHYLLTLLISLIFMVGCAPQPRYTSAPLEGAKESNQSAQPGIGKGKSNIDKGKMAEIIESYLGTPYKSGGESKRGIDCSGLVTQVYKEYAGFKLPHDTKKLYQLVKEVDEDDWAYGDLVFFSDEKDSISHVGIYMGDGKFIHSIEDFGVIVSSLDEDYYKKRYIGARRVIP